VGGDKKGGNTTASGGSPAQKETKGTLKNEEEKINAPKLQEIFPGRNPGTKEGFRKIENIIRRTRKKKTRKNKKLSASPCQKPSPEKGGQTQATTTKKGTRKKKVVLLNTEYCRKPKTLTGGGGGVVWWGWWGWGGGVFSGGVRGEWGGGERGGFSDVPCGGKGGKQNKLSRWLKFVMLRSTGRIHRSRKKGVIPAQGQGVVITIKFATKRNEGQGKWVGG